MNEFRSISAISSADAYESHEGRKHDVKKRR